MRSQGRKPGQIHRAAPAPVRLVFIGDVMLGRDVGEVGARDPGSIFERLRPALVDGDLSLANLESPLTSRPHAGTGYALEADPALAPLLAAAGLDVVDLANNHASDAGPQTVADTIAALRSADVRTVGAGEDAARARAPLTIDVGGIRVGVLAFDLTGGTAAGDSSPGVNPWRRAAARAAVTALRAQVDLLVVALHGGVEYLPHPDPVLQRAVDDLATWGVDVVWGHGAHVAYPVAVADGSRGAVLAPGLGNAVFDQQIPGTDEGTLLEVLGDRDGVVAMRTGSIAIRAGRASFTGWQDPARDAVAIRGEWWTPVRPVATITARPCGSIDIDRIATGLQADSRIVAAGCGSVTAAGAAEAVVAYRYPLERKLLQDAYPGRRWADADGLGAHLAVMAPDGDIVWAAGTLPDPIGAVAVCSGSLAVGLTALDDPAVVAASAWTWRSFGFVTAPPLDHPSSIGCTDVDHDGATEPLIRRSATAPGGSTP
jgi:poly-gamma-glutamate capsule biosynthesis protein CapA/YwtB (metallophosphatase superfamily)